jgi:FlaG/FlaF family flagellin (archaellin)
MEDLILETFNNARKNGVQLILTGIHAYERLLKKKVSDENNDIHVIIPENKMEIYSNININSNIITHPLPLQYFEIILDESILVDGTPIVPIKWLKIHFYRYIINYPSPTIMEKVLQMCKDLNSYIQAFTDDDLQSIYQLRNEQYSLILKPNIRTIIETHFNTNNVISFGKNTENIFNNTTHIPYYIGTLNQGARRVAYTIASDIGDSVYCFESTNDYNGFITYEVIDKESGLHIAVLIDSSNIKDGADSININGILYPDFPTLIKLMTLFYLNTRRLLDINIIQMNAEELLEMQIKEK